MDFNKSITNEDIPETKRTSHGHGKCEVNGCPWPGQIHTDGRWNCRYHFGVSGIKLGHVTLMLINHAAEVNWYEQLLLGTAEVDYACSDLKVRAPAGLEPLRGEIFLGYRKRIEAKITELLKASFTKPLPFDGKTAASGEKPTFFSIDEVLPGF